MTRFSVRSLIGLATAAVLFCSNGTASAKKPKCTNTHVPGGAIWETADPHVWGAWAWDSDRPDKNYLRVFFYAGRHSRDVYYNTDPGYVVLPSGTMSVFAANINTCGRLQGTDTYIRSIVIP